MNHNKKRKILVADDNLVCLELICKIIDHLGCNALAAADGLKALIIYEEQGADLILTDYDMPLMDGCTLAKRIKKHSPTTPVVMITGHHPDRISSRMEISLIDKILHKPIRFDDIKETVAEYFEISEPSRQATA